jgi:hypothetical protein
LNLRLNSIGKGSAAIFKGLTKNTSLAKLILSANFITEESDVELNECLKENKTLKELDLTSNNGIENCLPSSGNGNRKGYWTRSVGSDK